MCPRKPEKAAIVVGEVVDSTDDPSTALGHPSPFPITDSSITCDDELYGLWFDQMGSEGTKRNYIRILGQFKEWMYLSGLEIRSCRKEDLLRWSGTLTGAPATINSKINAIKSLFRFAHDLGYAQFNVSAPLKTKKNPTDLTQRILSVEEVYKLLEAAKKVKGVRGLRRVALISLLYYSAARRAEVSNLRWKHFTPKRGGGARVSLLGKGDKIRHVHIPEQAWRAIKAIDEAEGPEAKVFRLKPDGVNKAFKRIAKDAGLSKDASPHWLRHAHASHALEDGAPLHLIQQTLGHASVKTTSKYLHANPTKSSGDYLRTFDETEDE